jgi:hypothetical protein
LIRKSGNRLFLATNAEGVCADIMLKQKMDDEHDSTRLNHALAPFSARKEGREDRGHTRLGVAPFLAVPILQQLVVGMRRESAPSGISIPTLFLLSGGVLQ